MIKLLLLLKENTAKIESCFAFTGIRITLSYLIHRFQVSLHMYLVESDLKQVLHLT